MTAPIIAFFNNKGGVGKTSLVYHLAWMYQRLGLRVIAADLDPQANLTAAFLDDQRLEDIWLLDHQPRTIFRCVRPLMRGTGDIMSPHLEPIEPRLNLLVGDLQLADFEGNLAAEWPGCMDRKELSFRVTSAFWRLLQQAQAQQEANVILIDLGPNLGAINRAALIAADYVVVPLSPDLFSLQGLKNLGPTVRRWRQEWRERLRKNPAADLPLPSGNLKPVGYIVLQHLQYAARSDRPVKAYERWLKQIAGTYWEAVLNRPDATIPEQITDDPYCLALIKHYKSLMPLAQAAHKPIFQLTSEDGAIGASIPAAQQAYKDFELLARRIARNCKAYQQHATAVATP